MNRDKNKNNPFAQKFTTKPTLETAWADIPGLSLFPESTPDLPVLVDKEHCGKEYRIVPGEIYTARLGIHSHPEGLGAFTKDCIAMGELPTTVSKRLTLLALFGQPEIAPAVFLDYTNLNAPIPCRLELVKGSIQLESNNNADVIRLGDNAVSIEEDMIIISSDILANDLPKYLTYTYDFLSFQIRIAAEEDYFVEQRVHINNDDFNSWDDCVTAKIGDEVEFRVSYTNDGNSPQTGIKMAIDLPAGLDFVEGRAYLYESDRQSGAIDSFDILDPQNTCLKKCNPGETIIVYCTAEVTEEIAKDEDFVWCWTKIDDGLRVFEVYAQVNIEK